MCIDEETFEICSEMNLEDAILLRAEELEDERLMFIKETRRLNEYCWTLKPFFLEHVLSKYDFFENAVYLDADICFFNDPAPVFSRNKNYTVLLSEHDFSDNTNSVEDVCGKYNSGFIVFKQCKTSLDILKWWQDKCIDWCCDGVDDGRFGDQKYLDILPYIFEGVQSIVSHGVNIAPWNEGKYYFEVKDGKVYANGNKLICYHFCGLRLLDKKHFALLIGSQSQNSYIHTPYTIVVQEAISDIEDIRPEFDGYYVESHFQDKGKVFRIGR